MATWWSRAQPPRRQGMYGYNSGPLCHTLFCFQVHLPTWALQLPPRPSWACCGAVKAGNVSRAIRAESYLQIYCHAEWPAAWWPGTRPWVPLLLPPSAPTHTHNVVLRQAERDVTYCRTPSRVKSIPKGQYWCWN